MQAEARRSAEVTHNHPEGVRGAEATAVAVYLARTGRHKDEIRESIEASFGYDLRRRLDDIRPSYKFDESCQGTVPPAIIAFLESQDYEDAIRKAISLGGDADTLACITGGIAERSTVVYRRQSLSAPLVCWTSICARSHWPFVSAIH